VGRGAELKDVKKENLREQAWAKIRAKEVDGG